MWSTADDVRPGFLPLPDGSLWQEWRCEVESHRSSGRVYAVCCLVGLDSQVRYDISSEQWRVCLSAFENP